MAILDRELEFSDAQAVTVTAASTDIVDQVQAGEAGDELYLVIQVDTTVTAAGAATVTFAFETDDNSGFSSATALWTSAAIGKATLVAGYRVVKMRVPTGAEDWLRVYYTVATGPLTAGAFSAFLCKDFDQGNA
jgi:hypothetical protein